MNRDHGLDILSESLAGISSKSAASAWARSRWGRCWANRCAATRWPARGDAGESARPEETALCAEGEAGDSSVHGGCAQPARPVRLQAGAGASGGPAAAAVGDHGAALCVHPAGCRGAGAAVQVRAAWAMRGVALGDAAAPGGRRRRHLHRQIGAHGSVQSRPGADLLEHGLFAAGPAEPGVVGACTGWDPSRKTCRRLW